MKTKYKIKRRNLKPQASIFGIKKRHEIRQGFQSKSVGFITIKKKTRKGWF